MRPPERKTRLANNLHHNGTRLDGGLGIDRHIDGREVGGVRDGQDHAIFVTGFCDHRTVHLEHGLAGNDLVTLRSHSR